MPRQLAAVLIMLAIGSGTAAANSPLTGHTLSCSVAGGPIYGGCYYEVPTARLGPLSFSVGVDAQLASPASGRGSHLAPYLLTVLDLERGSLWAEVALPDSWGVPIIGRADAWRVGFAYQFQ